MAVQRAVRQLCPCAPDLGDKLRPPDGDPRPPHQLAQDPHLGRGQRDLHPRHAAVMGGGVQRQDTVVQRRGGGGPARAFQDGADTRHQLARRKGLGHIVVRAKLQPHHPVDLVVARGEKDHRHVRAGAQAAADLKPVDFGQADVEDDQVRRLARGMGQGALAVGGGDDAERRTFQRDGDHLTQTRIVVDNKDLHSPAPYLPACKLRDMRHLRKPQSRQPWVTGMSRAQGRSA